MRALELAIDDLPGGSVHVEEYVIGDALLRDVTGTRARTFRQVSLNAVPGHTVRPDILVLTDTGDIAEREVSAQAVVAKDQAVQQKLQG